MSNNDNSNNTELNKSQRRRRRRSSGNNNISSSNDRGRGRGRGQDSAVPRGGRGNNTREVFADVAAADATTVAVGVVVEPEQEVRNEDEDEEEEEVEVGAAAVGAHTDTGNDDDAVKPSTSDSTTQHTLDGSEEQKKLEETEDDEKMGLLHIEDIQSLFLGESKILHHIRALRGNKDKYIQQLKLFMQFGVITKVSTSTKAKIMCALLIQNQRDTVEWLLSHQRYYSVGEIAKCIQLLDAPRKARQYRRRLKRFLAAKEKNPKAVKDKTISTLRTQIHNLEVEPHSGSLNGAKCRMFLKWIQNIPKDRLEFFLLNFGTANWKLICDLIHPNPKKHFKCDYFQPAIFEPQNGDDAGIADNNAQLPIDSLVYQAKRVNKDNIVALLHAHPYLSHCYSYLRKRLLSVGANNDDNNGDDEDGNVEQSKRNKNNRKRGRRGGINAPRGYNQYRGGFGGAINSDNTLEGIEQKIKNLMYLGFTRHEALCALSTNVLNVESGAEWLFDENNREKCKTIASSTYFDYDLASQKDAAIPSEAKHILAENAPLEDILWWYDELHSMEVEMEVLERLKESFEQGRAIFSADSPRSNYGKLMERILSFREQKYKFVPHLISHAQLRLSNVRIEELSDEESCVRCAVLGDASGSMEVAIRSSCIIASLLSVALSADLKFFHSQVFDPPVVPRDVQQTVEVVDKIAARGGTCMASALYPYLQHRVKIDLFILVSDEGENEKYNGQYFSALWKTYVNSVNPKAQLFLVSFLQVGEEGLIMQRLKEKHVDEKTVTQFRLHPENPDTSKFNALLGMVALLLSGMKEGFYTIAEILTGYEGFTDLTAKTVANCICSYL
eukprot:CAMPEP_0202698592 /NCGR_PEP_ID=MMETSP1385-20130828/11867_1 /ASSEMBLY_ACC=CAM_ASM_000861 /TAXON_ID=933848 /ORGANISM="Elphidium margaritaceum" /LENGTH=839 /DNA_ID=CAMNT_0049355345 /DNA_START=73 /DNA_END=2592 /DNA_ORIENTATION=+